MDDQDVKKNIKKNVTEETSGIDLGDDLLEHTNAFFKKDPTVTRLPRSTAQSVQEKVTQSESEQDLLQNADILLNEGLVAEAKKTLRKIVILFPQSKEAVRRLSVIQEQEIKQLMRDPSSIHEQRDSLSKKRSPRYLDEIEQSLFEEDLVKNLVTHQDYFLPLKNIVIQNYTLRQLLDLCIGYYEIGLYTQVIDLAKQIRQSLSVDEKEVKSAAIMDSILSLEAQSHFDLKQFSESISLLQTCLAQKNQNTARAHPEIYYLLAKSYLAWGQQESALYWFHKLSEDYPEESDYRDSKEILSRIRGMKQSYD